MRKDCGVAFVEVLLGILVVAIIAGIFMMAMIKPADHSVEHCRADAKAFTIAVARYYESNGAKWPPDGRPKYEPSVLKVSLNLRVKGELTGDDPLRRLAGPLRTPPTDDKGWTYDFENHSAIDAGCNEL
jgi:hypothetical protein